MRGHAGLAGSAHAVAFLCLGENNGRLPLRCLRLRERREEFAEVVAAALELIDFTIGHVGDEIAHLGITSKKLAQVVRAVLRPERLIFAVNRLREATQEMMLLVAREDRVPL